MIAIEHNHPAPFGQRFRLHSGQQELRETLDAMQPGDSFVFQGFIQHAHRAANQINAKITCRKLETGGYRIWRLK